MRAPFSSEPRTPANFDRKAERRAGRERGGGLAAARHRVRARCGSWTAGRPPQGGPEDDRRSRPTWRRCRLRPTERSSASSICGGQRFRPARRMITEHGQVRTRRNPPSSLCRAAASRGGAGADASQRASFPAPSSMPRARLLPGATVSIRVGRHRPSRPSRRARTGDSASKAPAAPRSASEPNGFADAVTALRGDATTVRVVLHPRPLVESVTVTASRGATGVDTAASASIVSSGELLTSAAGAIDDALRNTPGFSLFRRSSSRVANPTTQGVTLRGVSGSGASRTLVVADGWSLNDPFGSWVYWNRIPLAAVDRIEVVRGATGDLYGADALGGVIQVLTLDAESPAAARDRRRRIAGARCATSGFGGRKVRPLAASLPVASGRTPTAPSSSPRPIAARSMSRPTATINRDSDRRATTAAVGGRPSARNYASEDRGNGTPMQVNDTQWRQVSGDVNGAVGRRLLDGAGHAAARRTTSRRSPPLRPIAQTERLTNDQTIPGSFCHRRRDSGCARGDGSICSPVPRRATPPPTSARRATPSTARRRWRRR